MPSKKVNESTVIEMHRKSSAIEVRKTILNDEKKKAAEPKSESIALKNIFEKFFFSIQKD